MHTTPDVPSPQEEVPTLQKPAAWDLVAPDWSVLDTIRRSPWPFVLWSVCEKPLLAHWLDEAVRQGIPDVRILAVDRPHLIREWLQTQNIWSRDIEILSDPDAPQRSATEGRTQHIMAGLPGAKHDMTCVSDAVSLLHHWMDLHRQALALRSSSTVHLDHEIKPGVWVGPGAKIAPDAELHAPCWIGSYARIGTRCRLGPDAYIGPGSFLDEDVEVADSLICGDTYVGAHTSLRKMIAQGALLLDVQRAAAVEITDHFMLSGIGPMNKTPTVLERVVAAVTYPVASALARLLSLGSHPRKTNYRVRRSLEIPLLTWPRGPLILRRAEWLREIVAGRLRWIGILPRTEDEWNLLPPDLSAVLEAAPVGVFSLADLHGAHSADNPEEWLHASYQAASPDGIGARMASKSLFRIAFLTPHTNEN